MAERVASMSPEELIAVVTAGLDVDEQKARAAGDLADVKVVYSSQAEQAAQYDFLGRHSPARVLADVESKREIVALAESLFSREHGHDKDERGVEFGHPIARRRMRDVLAALARPYLAQETP